MGCGKSVVGVLVAQRAGAPFHDLDLEIESEAGMSITEIFETKG
ncbi:MAG TPA: shikimate kinase, partial [Candidatus Saccharimonadia bacterium]|nr:shikimate kinase [Candidatus Saccharimonadia bacterium]